MKNKPNSIKRLIKPSQQKNKISSGPAFPDLKEAVILTVRFP